MGTHVTYLVIDRSLGGWITGEIKRKLGVGGDLYSWADKNADYLRREYEKALPYLAITRKPVTVRQVEDRAAREINDLKAKVSRLENLLVKTVSFEGVTFEGGYCIKEDDELTRAILRDQGFEEHELPIDRSKGQGGCPGALCVRP